MAERLALVPGIITESGSEVNIDLIFETGESSTAYLLEHLFHEPT